MQWLIFRLYGPLASWGGVAVGEVRDSDTHPGKSAVLGLVAATLGIRRDQEARLQALAEDYGYAVQVELTGLGITDYHTAQVPSRSTLKGRPHATRKDELAMPRDKLNTILSSRTYRCDALYRVALWARSETAQPLSTLASALQRPTFVPYLGRKSCALALPLEPQLVEADSLSAALDAAAFASDALLERDRLLGRRRDRDSLHWEDDPRINAGIDADMTISRRDGLRSRQRWQYAPRREHRALRRED